MHLALIRLSALGDIIHTWPLVLSLRNHRPDLHLTWVVEEPFRPLVEDHPAVDSVITVATKRWRKAPFTQQTRAETGAVKTRLRELTPDLVLDSQGTTKSAWITRWADAVDRVGLARPWRRELLPALVYSRVLPGSEGDPHVVATNCHLVRAIGGEPVPNTPSPDGRWLLERALERWPDFRRKAPYAVLLPGAGQPSKVLSTDVLATLARLLESRGLEVVVAWGPGELERAEAVVAGAGETAEVAPPTNIEQLAVLLGGASVVVGADTGPIHLAASLGTPTLGVFLTTDWRRNGPLGPHTAVLSAAQLPQKVHPGRAGARPGVMPSAETIDRKVAQLLAGVTIREEQN
ncbi:MAG: lipopolysaccharide heptosyltransferase I [Acidobacteria bacterium]|nr:MAG: lipopolysaccharide heptosyltransferase I [Acidobacteriota bacterium]